MSWALSLRTPTLQLWGLYSPTLHFPISINSPTFSLSVKFILWLHGTRTQIQISCLTSSLRGGGRRIKVQGSLGKSVRTYLRNKQKVKGLEMWLKR
jgi:hypothetical protein